FGFCFQSKRSEISQQMSENLEAIARGKAIGLEHDRRIKRGNVAMPDIVRDASGEDVGVTAFERLRQREFRNGVALPEIFAQEEPIDPGCVAAHDHVLIVVGKNLRLNKIAW